MSIRDGRDGGDGGDRVDDSVETRNQILDKPSVDFDSRMDDVDSESEQGEGPDESETGKDGGGEKSGFMDKLKGMFSRNKETGEGDDSKESSDTSEADAEPSKEAKFRESMSVGNEDNHIEHNAMDNMKSQSSDAHEDSDADDDQEPDADIEKTHEHEREPDHSGKQLDDDDDAR